MPGKAGMNGRLLLNSCTTTLLRLNFLEQTGTPIHQARAWWDQGYPAQNLHVPSEGKIIFPPGCILKLLWQERSWALQVNQGMDFIPQRDLNPPPPPVTCDDDFKAQVSTVLSQLAAAYLDVSAKHDQGQVDPAASPLEANKKLVKSLNKSGQYMAMRNGLKAAIVRT
eukprot:scaffold166277_cov16-Tisochrysis_lutea.AAC.1